MINNGALNEYDDCLILSAERSESSNLENSNSKMRVLFLKNEEIFYLEYSEHSIEYSVFNFDVNLLFKY